MSLISRIPNKFYQKGIGRSLRHFDYRVYSLTNFVAMIGLWQQRIAIGWLAWELTESGFWLGVVAMSESLPLILLVAIAGAVTDRVDRLRLLRTLQMIQVSIAVILTLLTVNNLVNIYVLTVLSFGYGLVQAFHLPVRMTIAPNLVPREDLTPAIGLNSAFFNTSRFAGPMIAGVVIANFGVGLTLGVGVACMLVFTIGLKFIKLARNEQLTHNKSGIVQEILEGIRYVGSHSSIGPLLLLIMISAVFSRSFMDLFPGFADQVFGQGPEGLGMLFSAVGAGGIVGAFWLANYGRTTGLTKVSFSTLFMTSILLLIFSVTSNFWVGVVTATLLGVSLAITSNSSQILIQNKVVGSVRGRVMSLYSLTYRAGPAIGALLMGSLSTWIGLQIPVAGGALICLISIAIILPHQKRIASELEGRDLLADDEKIKAVTSELTSDSK